MPAPFEPVHIPFVSGARQDLGKLAQEGPSYLREAKNVLFTKRGHITNRPTAVSRNAQTQLGINPALTGSLATPVTGATPSGLVATGFPTLGPTGTDTPLACWQGQSYFNRSGIWEFAGTHWSLRQTKSAALEVHDPPASGLTPPISVGQDLVATVTSVGNTAGVPFLAPAGEVKWISTNVPTAVVGSFDNVNRSLTAVAGNLMFWKFNNAGTRQVYYMVVTGQGPTTGIETLLSNMSSGGGLGATTDGTFMYVAFGGGAGAPGTSTVMKIGAAGNVLQTLVLTWTGAADVGGTMDICYDPVTNRLGVVLANGLNVLTKTLTLTAGVMADSGSDLTLSGTPAGTANVCCGVTHNGHMSVIYTRATSRWDTGALHPTAGTLYVGGRTFLGASELTFTTLEGAVNANGIGLLWSPLFAGRAVAGRTLVGAYRGFESITRSSQWVVMDFTDLYASGNTARRVPVAAGTLNGYELCVPGSVYSDASKVSFGVSEGILFAPSPSSGIANGAGQVPQVSRAAVRRITLEAQAVQAVQAHETTLLSGQLMHVFDGNKIRPHHFVEEAPYIFNGPTGFVYASIGGSLAAGSYSYQATWEAVNSRGQTIRSGASAITTVNGVTLNQQVTLRVTKPQLWTNASPAEFVRVRLWATQTNPVNSSPKFLVAESVTSTPSIGAFITMVHTAVPTGTEEQLYEDGGILADMRAPGADRGIVMVNERVWCADQTKLYASKILRPNIAVSWNTESAGHTLGLPTALGTIQALSAIQNTVVVLCSRGVAVVIGPGVDDLGLGQGWSLQILEGVPGTGESGPRSAVTTTAGVAYQTQDGDVWLVGADGSSVPISRAVRNSATRSTTALDVALIPATPETNALLVAQGLNGVLRVLDLEMGQWCTWEFPGLTPAHGRYIAAIDGALWLQLDGATPVVSIDDPDGTSDIGVGTTSATVETGTLSPGAPAAHGWGRLRSVVPNEVRLFGSTPVDITMQVFADQNERVLMNKTKTTNPNNGAVVTGGGDGSLEFRTSVQRCAHVRVRMTVSPALFDMEGLDLWVANTGEKSPTNNRS